MLEEGSSIAGLIIITSPKDYVMKKNNILVSALGAQPDIIEETIGFINYGEFVDFYRDHTSFSQIQKRREEADFVNNHADELWLIATDREHILKDFEIIKNNCSKYVAKIRLFILKGVQDITNEEEANAFHDLTLRVVTFAKQRTNGGKLYLSLACGRKTMSNDFQDAAYCIGCDALIHVLGDSKENAFPLNLGKISNNEALRFDLQSFEDKEICCCEPQDELLKAINSQKKKTQYFYTTYYLNEKEVRSNFHILYTLPPSKIKTLREDKIGLCESKLEEELKWIRRLPKTDLHCHLGGVLSAVEMLEVAKCYKPLIQEARKNNSKFSEWKCEYDPSKPLKTWYNELSKTFGVHKGLIAASLILSYEERQEDLNKLIFGKYVCEKDYRAIGIRKYESLGDLQGSALLCNEDAIRKTVQILLNNCKKENVSYVEIRCSPINYVTDTLSATQVLNAIFEELERVPEIESSVIIIASRHGEPDKITQSIDLVHNLYNDELFKKYFRGFDLAGDEQAKTPKELREQFIDIMKECHNITIHAGETAPADNIWEAVYHLTAERIGHGLNLADNQELLIKILERGIGLEMCPSSNYQIVGYRDNYYPETADLQKYPLKYYLDKELKVSVNTDNPGISRTTVTNELHKAARLTEGGLSRWDIIQLICNGFKTSFYPYEEKKLLIRNAEKRLGELINNGLL